MALFLVTACSVKYNLTINDNLSILEEAKLTGTDAFFANYYKTTKKNVLSSLLEQYKGILTENGYSYNLIDEEKPYINVSKDHNSIDSFTKNSILFNDYFDEVKYTENGNIKRIETIGFNENNPDNPERFDVKELEISITCPYKVVNHNATRYDIKTNTYYYELSEQSNYKILLEFDASKKFNPNERIILIVIICILVIVATWVTIYILNKKKI